MDKVALFAFRGELMCFVHVLLNALDLDARGTEARIVFEGASVALVRELADPACPFHGLYAKARERGLVDGACKACSAKLGVLDQVQAQGLPLLEGMSGHPAMGDYLARGFTLLTF